MDVISRIDRARRDTDVLEHPFYRRWATGGLSAEELAFYARQYRHAVEALGQASSNLAETAGAEHAAQAGQRNFLREAMAGDFSPERG